LPLPWMLLGNLFYRVRSMVCAAGGASKSQIGNVGLGRCREKVPRLESNWTRMAWESEGTFACDGKRLKRGEKISALNKLRCCLQVHRHASWRRLGSTSRTKGSGVHPFRSVSRAQAGVEETEQDAARARPLSLWIDAHSLLGISSSNRNGRKRLLGRVIEPRVVYRLVAARTLYCGGGHGHSAQNRSDPTGNCRVTFLRACFPRTRTDQSGSLQTPGDLLSPAENWKAGRNRATVAHFFSSRGSH